MQDVQYLYVCGDIHGNWGKFNRFLNDEIKQNKEIKNDINKGKNVEVIVLQTGDFGWWPHFHNRKFSNKKIFDQFGIKNDFIGIKNNKIKIIWCAGNHENHDDLDLIEKNSNNKNFIELMPNIFYATFGAVYELINGEKIMFCGGASSIDKVYRIPGESWWAGETISESDMYHLPEIQKIDIIVSHTCPTSFNKMFDFYIYSDPSQKFLDYILNNYNPTLWFFGHFHCYNKMIINNCVATVLSDCESSQKYYKFLGKIEK